MTAKIGKSLAAAAFAALVALPLAVGPSQADAASCSTRKLNGTLLGVAGGALLGDAVTRGSTGTIVGGLAGAVAGREIARKGCDDRPTYRSAAPGPAYRAPARTATRAPAPVVREAPRPVYYDPYGRPVAADYRR